MKIHLIIALTCFVVSFVSAQKKNYVCTPCGRRCDKEDRAKDGTCQSCGMTLVEKSTITFSDLSIQQFCARLKANPNVILLDVRTPAEFDGTPGGTPSFGHFKNAININVEELESRLAELSKFKTQEVLVYCSHSQRSPRASYVLSTHGFSNVANLAGGVSTLSRTGNECLNKYFVRHTR